MISTQVLSVSQLTIAIKSRLEPYFAHIQVRGEVTNLKMQTSGHLYFTLKDESSQIAAVLFKGSSSRIHKLPQSGDQVVVKGEISVYSPRGQYQIIVRELELSGVGELLLKLHQLKLALQERGWFDPKRKKPLPKYPKTIGVVTSPTGSVIQDILNVLKRRYRGFHLIIHPVKVQGAGAEKEIAKAIDAFNEYKLADVLIVGRGGGSLEDLWAFNEECVAKAIFSSQIPIISAVGHETDTCIADYVADIRAPTPSAAAELSMQEMDAQLTFLEQSHKRLSLRLKELLKSSKKELQSFVKNPLFIHSDTFLGNYFQKLDEISPDIHQVMKHFLLDKKAQLHLAKGKLETLKPQTQITNHLLKLRQINLSLNQALHHCLRTHDDTLEHLSEHLNVQIKNLLNLKKSLNFSMLYKNLQKSYLNLLKERKEKLENVREHLRLIDPKNLLKRGYCIPLHVPSHKVITSSMQVERGEQIGLQFVDGYVTTTVDTIQRGTS